MPGSPARAPGRHGSCPSRTDALPPYLRKTTSLEELYPWLYLKSTKRDCRSTSVAMCEFRAPDSKSPSQ